MYFFLYYCPPVVQALFSLGHNGCMAWLINYYISYIEVFQLRKTDGNMNKIFQLFFIRVNQTKKTHTRNTQLRFETCSRLSPKHTIFTQVDGGGEIWVIRVSNSLSVSNALINEIKSHKQCCAWPRAPLSFKSFLVMYLLAMKIIMLFYIPFNMVIF